ncbi:MAG: amidophosphoribosyltransferase [Methanomicrobiales archaeon]|nr:amidophosphoribosyltransferase [Methanomicrobiales archaeon]MDD1647921.1 amidophosphoribosyltransferase [Methanomicrobiales archaeon]
MCGIVGIADAGGVSFSLYHALYALQHRGQESAGISTYADGCFYKHKGQGLVGEVFDRTALSGLKGNVGVGHVRYPTTGANLPENIQPFNFRFRDHFFAIAHNGNLVNAAQLRAEYEQAGEIYSTTTDTEVIASVIVDEYRKGHSIQDAIVLCLHRLRGSYSVVLMVDDELYAFRDPLGIKPLCFGTIPGGHIVASESVAIDVLGGTLIREVRPGEMLRLTHDGYDSLQITMADRPAHCIFEFIYFARADSVIEEQLVYDVRRKIGASLYDEAPVKADLVSPVPDSGTSIAIGFAHHSGIPYLEGLMKNRYMGRTFIKPSQKERELAVRIKLNPITGHICGKSVVLVDDSIVRGTTSRHIVDLMKESGAEEVHVRIGSPPIKAPCYLGVDMPTREELIASDKETQQVRESINATSLHHISLDALVQAIGLPKEHLCTGCLTGGYPVPIEGESCMARIVDFVGGTYQTKLGAFKGEGQGQEGKRGSSVKAIPPKRARSKK